MAVVIRLMRAGAKKRPFYRVVVADSRRQRDGRFIEILGHYDPIAKPYALTLQTEKVAGWIATGARPSEQVASLLKKAGMQVAKPATRPKKKPAAAAAPAARRGVARKLSERKTGKKALRAARKSAGVAAPRKAKKAKKT